MAGGNQGRQMLVQGIQKIKKRRTKKLQQGLPVVGIRVRRRRQKKGLPVPINVPQVFPAAVGTAITGTSDPPKVEERTEQSFDVLSPGVVNAIEDQPVALTPNNCNLFVSLPTLSSQHQYYKWLSLRITYTQTAAYDTPGTLALGFAASNEAALLVNTYSALTALVPSVQTPVFKAATLDIPAKAFNQQFALQGCSNVPFSVQDDANPQNCPGYLIVGFTGLDPATSPKDTKLGTLTIHYKVALMKKKQDPSPNGSLLMISGAVPTSVDWWEALMAKYNLATFTHHDLELSQPAATELRFTAKTVARYIIGLTVHCTAAGGSCTAATSGSGSVATHHVTSGANNFMWTFEWTPAIRNEELTLTRSATAADMVQLHAHRIQNTTANWSSI